MNLFMLSVRISSYGCMREVWRARKMRKSNFIFLRLLESKILTTHNKKFYKNLHLLPLWWQNREE